MSENTKPTHKAKKRYLAIAALAGLVATGGIIGATVSQSTAIEGNRIEVLDAVPHVEATGTALHVQFVRGEAPDSKELGHAYITLTNTGNATAMVNPQAVQGLKLAGKPGTKNLDAHLAIRTKGGSQTPTWTQFIGLGTGSSQTSGMFPLKANSSVTLEVYLTAKDGKTTWDQFDTFDRTFDLKFDYIADK